MQRLILLALCSSAAAQIQAGMPLSFPMISDVPKDAHDMSIDMALEVLNRKVDLKTGKYTTPTEDDVKLKKPLLNTGNSKLRYYGKKVNFKEMKKNENDQLAKAFKTALKQASFPVQDKHNQFKGI